MFEKDLRCWLNSGSGSGIGASLRDTKNTAAVGEGIEFAVDGRTTEALREGRARVEV
jgi:hypothetical protein